MTFHVPQKLVKTRLFGLIWVLIFAFLFSWFIYFSLFRLIFKLSPTQQLVFYMDTYEKIVEKPEQLQKLLDNETLKEQGLVDISYYSFSIYDEETPLIKGVVDEVDFAIIPKGIADSYTGMKDDFYPVNEVVDLPSQYETSYDGLAIKIHDPSDDEYNNQFLYSSWLNITKDEGGSSYYLLISKYSKNFDKENNHILGYTSLDLFLNNNLK